MRGTGSLMSGSAASEQIKASSNGIRAIPATAGSFRRLLRSVATCAGRLQAWTAAVMSALLKGSSSTSSASGTGGPVYPASRVVITHLATPVHRSAHCRSMSSSRLRGACVPGTVASRGTSSRASISSVTVPLVIRFLISAADLTASSSSSTR